MAFITIDASQVTNALRVIEQSAQATPAVLSGVLDAAARQRIALLKANTPYQARVDPRYPTHLRDSYHYRSSGLTREIYISPLGSAFKYMYVTEGTAAHSILPNAKRALYWPGIQGGRPVASVYHPGTRANPFNERAEQQYTNGGAEAQTETAVANGYAEMITNSINAGAGDMGGGMLSGMGGALLGLAALLSMLAGLGGAALA